MHFLTIVLWIAIVAGIVWVVRRFVGCVTVRENTAALFERAGEFVYGVMSSKDRHFNEDGKIEEGSGSQSYGFCFSILRLWGWVFFLRPFVKSVGYDDYNDEDGFGKGSLVYLNDVVLQPLTPKAETAAPENIPLDVKWAVLVRVVDPYKWVYTAPRDARAKVVVRLVPLLRQWIRSGNEDHAQAGKGNGKKIWEEITATGSNKVDGQSVINDICGKWGLEIVENGITVADITPDKGHQEALQSTRNAKLKADARVEETAGRIKSAVAMELGLTVEGLNEKLNTNPEFAQSPAYVAALVFAKDMVKRDSAGGGLQDFRIGSVDGGPLPHSLTFLSVGGGGGAGAMVAGNQGNRGNRKGGRDNRRQEPKDEGDDDLRQLDEFVAEDERRQEETK